MIPLLRMMIFRLPLGTSSEQWVFSLPSFSFSSWDSALNASPNDHTTSGQPHNNTLITSPPASVSATASHYGELNDLLILMISNTLPALWAKRWVGNSTPLFTTPRRRTGDMLPPLTLDTLNQAFSLPSKRTVGIRLQTSRTRFRRTLVGMSPETVTDAPLWLKL